MLSHLVLIQDELAHVSDALGSGLEIDLGQTLPRALSRRPSAACPPGVSTRDSGRGGEGMGVWLAPHCASGVHPVQQMLTVFAREAGRASPRSCLDALSSVLPARTSCVVMTYWYLSCFLTLGYKAHVFPYC